MPSGGISGIKRERRRFHGAGFSQKELHSKVDRDSYPGADCFGALVFAITLTVINVFTRYCLHFTIKGSDEYVCIAFAWMVFPGTAAAYRRHMHYGVDLLVNAFPHKVRCIVDVVVQLIITVIMAICTYLTWILIQNVGSKIMTATRISYRVLDSGMLVGFVLMTIYAVVFLVQAVRCLPAKLKEGGPTE